MNATSLSLAVLSTILFAEPTAPKADTVRVAGIVLKWVLKDKEANYRRIEPLVREAAAGGAKIVCTTESFLDGYSIRDKGLPWHDYHQLAEPIPGGEYVVRLAKLAEELRIYLIAGMLERDGDRLHNSAVLFGPDGAIVGTYRKCQLDHEVARNTPGAGYPTFATEFGRVGIMICADRRYPHTMAGLKASGVDFVFCPSGGMWGPKTNDPLLQARSKEGQVPIVFVHPIEFLVTLPDGSIAQKHYFGDNMDEDAANDGARKRGIVHFHELPVRRLTAPTRND